jgi:hypothetical protein
VTSELSDEKHQEVTARQVMSRALVPVIVAWLLIPLTFVVPLIDSTRAPYIDLTQTFSLLVYWLAWTGSKFGVPIIALVMLVVLVTRDGINAAKRWKEVFIIVLVASIFAGGGAAINEHIVKEQLKIPRPNIVWLAGENGSGSLGMTPNPNIARVNLVSPFVAK